jgi:L-rhamnose isomerase/sugar isomerase
VLGGHEILLDAFNTDVRGACAASRVALGAAENPIRALRESGYAARMATERETQQELTR